MKIAVLLPSSSTHKQIGYDFYLALQYALVFKEIDITWMSASIGYGIDENDILSKAENMLLNNNPDILVAFAEYPKISCLFPLLEATNKPLFLVNMGAKLPQNWAPHTHVFHLNLQEAFIAHAMGKNVALGENKNAVFAANYYEGGYNPCQVMADSFLENDGEIVYNFIPQAQSGTFGMDDLRKHLLTVQQPTAVLANYSSPLTPVFWAEWGKMQANALISLQCSSTLLMESMQDYELEAITNQAAGFVAWDRRLDHTENRDFIRVFEAKLNRKATFFAALGWDLGLVLIEFIAADTLDTNVFAAKLTQSGKQISLTRGLAQLDVDFKTLVAPYYKLTVANNGIKLKEEEAATVIQAWLAFKIAYPEPNQSGWYNTYLCS